MLREKVGELARHVLIEQDFQCCACR
jgi:hypothetical protein